MLCKMCAVLPVPFALQIASDKLSRAHLVLAEMAI